MVTEVAIASSIIKIKLITGCASMKPLLFNGIAKNTVDVIAPAMKNSPWAKLIIKSTP